MKKLKCLISLSMQESPYQRLLAAVAQETARRLGLDVQTIYAANDPITQSDQLLKAIQSPEYTRPDGILCSPVGTNMVQVARHATAKGIGWILLNRDDDYIAEVRRTCTVPVFCVGMDQVEIGRIQGLQLGALLPEGGLVLYILGPNYSIAQRRLSGMQSTKPAKVEVRTLPGNWSEESGYKALSGWLRLSTSETSHVALVAGQNDAMAMGARRAFDELTGLARARWVDLLFTGVDYSPGAGEEWVRKGLLAASVRQHPVTGVALEMFVDAMQAKSQPPINTLLAPEACPEIRQLLEIPARRGVYQFLSR
jgi:ribose transport system substrate-binding protein